jgi:hypothetical protein
LSLWLKVKYSIDWFAVSGTKFQPRIEEFSCTPFIFTRVSVLTTRWFPTKKLSFGAEWLLSSYIHRSCLTGISALKFTFTEFLLPLAANQLYCNEYKLLNSFGPKQLIGPLYFFLQELVLFLFSDGSLLFLCELVLNHQKLFT